MTTRIPTVDLQAPDPAVVDEALQRAGFLLVTGHGVLPAARAELRAAARRFFALPPEVKQRYAVRIGGRGWLAPGGEANAYADEFDGDPENQAGAPPPRTSRSRSRSGRSRRPGTRPSTRCGSRPTSGPPRCPSCRSRRSGT